MVLTTPFIITKHTNKQINTPCVLYYGYGNGLPEKKTKFLFTVSIGMDSPKIFIDLYMPYKELSGCYLTQKISWIPGTEMVDGKKKNRMDTFVLILAGGVL